MPTRREVYDALDSERAYQEMRIKRDGSTSAQPEGKHSPEEFLVYMDNYLHEAKRVATHTWGPKCTPAVMEVVRKVTALGVACMEANGAPQREGFETAKQDEQPMTLEQALLFVSKLVAFYAVPSGPGKKAMEMIRRSLEYKPTFAGIDAAKPGSDKTGLGFTKPQATEAGAGCGVGAGSYKVHGRHSRTFTNAAEATAYAAGYQDATS